uniref:hypothetical protein n=1 Tax=Endozoicomonas sp. ONNA2 TaxID=2828741 RepID=UPI0021490663
IVSWCHKVADSVSSKFEAGSTAGKWLGRAVATVFVPFGIIPALVGDTIHGIKSLYNRCVEKKEIIDTKIPTKNILEDSPVSIKRSGPDEAFIEQLNQKDIEILKLQNAIEATENELKNKSNEENVWRHELEKQKNEYDKLQQQFDSLMALKLCEKNKLIEAEQKITELNEENNFFKQGVLCQQAFTESANTALEVEEAKRWEIRILEKFVKHFNQRYDSSNAGSEEQAVPFVELRFDVPGFGEYFINLPENLAPALRARATKVTALVSSLSNAITDDLVLANEDHSNATNNINSSSTDDNGRADSATLTEQSELKDDSLNDQPKATDANSQEG